MYFSLCLIRAPSSLESVNLVLLSTVSLRPVLLRFVLLQQVSHNAVTVYKQFIYAASIRGKLFIKTNEWHCVGFARAATNAMLSLLVISYWIYVERQLAAIKTPL